MFEPTNSHQAPPLIELSLVWCCWGYVSYFFFNFGVVVARCTQTWATPKAAQPLRLWCLGWDLRRQASAPWRWVNPLLLRMAANVDLTASATLALVLSERKYSWNRAEIMVLAFYGWRKIVEKMCVSSVLVCLSVENGEKNVFFFPCNKKYSNGVFMCK